MDYTQGQAVFFITSPSILGLEVKEAFQVIKGTYLFAQQNIIFIKVNLRSDLAQETVVTVEKEHVFTNIKSAIDKAYDKYTNTNKDAVDTRPETSTTEHNEVV